MREAPKKCPVCESTVKVYPTGRILCEANGCDFEWIRNPKVILNELPEVNIERLKNPNLTNCEIACYLLGWQGGTVYQVAGKLDIPVEMVLKAKDIRGLIDSYTKRSMFPLTCPDGEEHNFETPSPSDTSMCCTRCNIDYDEYNSAVL